MLTTRPPPNHDASHISFKFYAIDNMTAGHAAADGTLIVSTADADNSPVAITSGCGCFSSLDSPTLANINGCSAEGFCGCGGNAYIPDPEYTVSLCATLAASTDRSFSITVANLTGTYSSRQWAIDNVVVTKDIGTLNVAGRGTSANGVLLNWANSGYTSNYVISQSTDGGSTFTPIATAGATDTGVLLTNITNDGSTYFKVDAFSDSGYQDTTNTVQITPGSGTAGVYTVTSSDLSSPIVDVGASISSGLSIVNSTVAAGSQEEAILMAIGGTINSGANTYTPLSGALQYFDQDNQYVTATSISGIGAAGTHIGSSSGGTYTDVMGIAESWQPGDDPTGYAFTDAFIRFTVTRTNDFSASVVADQPLAVRDTATPASFTITRSGDFSAAATVTFHLTDDTSGSGYTVDAVNYYELAYSAGEYTYSFGAGEATAQILLTPDASSWTGNTTLTIDSASDTNGAQDIADMFADPPTTTDPSPTPAPAATAGIAGTAPALTAVPPIIKHQGGNARAYTFSAVSVTANVIQVSAAAGTATLGILITDNGTPATGQQDTLVFHCSIGPAPWISPVRTALDGTATTQISIPAGMSGTYTFDVTDYTFQQTFSITINVGP